MKKILMIILAVCLGLLFLLTGLFALRKINRPLKTQAHYDSARIVICSKALEALGKIGDPRMKNALIKGFKNKEFLIRTSAAEALNKLNDKKTIPLLMESLEDSDPIIRILVTKALLNLGQPGMEDRLLDFLNNNDASVRAAVVEQLGQFKDKYLPRIAKVLAEDNNFIVRLRAIQQLGINRYHPALPLIEQALKNPNPRIRQVACIAIGQIKDSSTVHLIIERLTDQEAIVRSAAKEALSMFKTEEKESTGISRSKGRIKNEFLILLRKDLESKDPALKISSFVGLANLKDITILPLLLKEVILVQNSTLVKKGAARALRILQPYLDDFLDQATKSSVISSVNLELSYRVNSQNLLWLVINALEDTANPLHADSVFILAELKDADSLPALRQALLQEDPDIVANAAYTLGLFQDKEAVSGLLNLCNRYGL
jgi:HEAT repeat protein